MPLQIFFIFVSESIIFHSKFESPAHRKRERKWYMMNIIPQWWMKLYIFDVRCKSFPVKTKMRRKHIKDKEASLGISIKKIGLLCTNVIASLWLALPLEALVKTSLLDKIPHHIKVGLLRRTVCVLAHSSVTSNLLKN